MQISTASPPAKKPPDAAFGAFLFALGTMLLVLVPWVPGDWLITVLMGFTGGLLIAGGLYLIIKEAVRNSKLEARIA